MTDPMASAATRAAATVPSRAGVGFKLTHTEDLIADPSRVGFVEIHAENYMSEGGPAHRALERVRAELPLSLHGVGLSIGGQAPLDREHLARLVRVAERYEVGLVSEHLAWSSHGGTYLNDLLPLPYTEATLADVVRHIDEVQDALGRAMLLENPSSYVAFEASTMDELAFITRIVASTGCGLILDVNNVHVSATNLGFTAQEYVERFPLHAVGEVHLAGHASETDAAGEPLLIDAHDRPVASPVWDLYEAVVARLGRAVPTLIEWDNDVPAFAVLAEEAARAEARMAVVLSARADQGRRAA